MNDQTIKLIEQLAEKFGTTAEHLWSVLIKQAPIYGWTNVLFLATMPFALFFVTKKLAESFEVLSSYQEDNSKNIIHGAAFIIYGSTLFLISVFLLTSIFDVDLILASFFNPEYWAMKQILK